MKIGTSRGALLTILAYLPPHLCLHLQLVNKLFYNTIVPQTLHQVPHLSTFSELLQVTMKRHLPEHENDLVKVLADGQDIVHFARVVQLPGKSTPTEKCLLT